MNVLQLILIPFSSTNRIKGADDEGDDAEAGRTFASNVVSALKSAALVSGNLNTNHDPEDTIAVAGAQLANEEISPIDRMLLQQNVRKTKSFHSGMTGHQVLGVGGSMRGHRNNLDSRVGTSLAVAQPSAEQYMLGDHGSSAGGAGAASAPSPVARSGTGKAKRTTPIKDRVAKNALLASVHVPCSKEREQIAAFTKELLTDGSDLNKAASVFPAEMCSQEAKKALEVYDETLQQSSKKRTTSSSNEEEGEE